MAGPPPGFDRPGVDRPGVDPPGVDPPGGGLPRDLVAELARSEGDGPRRVVLLTARDPLVGADEPLALTVAASLAGDGHSVTLALLEDAVVLARARHRHNALVAAAVEKGVRVVAEDEALARRGIAAMEPRSALAVGVEPASLGEVVELLLRRSDRQAWL